MLVWSHLLSFLFRKACVLSWSHKPATFPCYSGILLELPRINQNWVHVCGLPPLLLIVNIVYSGSSYKPSLFLVQVAFAIWLVLIRRVYPLALAARHISILLVAAPLLLLYPLSWLAIAISLNPRRIPPAKCRNWSKGLELKGNGKGLSVLLVRLLTKLSIRLRSKLDIYRFHLHSLALNLVCWPAVISHCLAYDSAAFSSSSGMRCASGPNPFTRGPSASNVTLSCHDVGQSFLLWSSYHVITCVHSSYLRCPKGWCQLLWATTQSWPTRVHQLRSSYRVLCCCCIYVEHLG